MVSLRSARFRLAVFFIAAGLLGGGCDSDEDALPPGPPEADGLAYAKSDQSVGTTYNALTGALRDAQPISIVSEYGFVNVAARAGISLRPTRVVLFGNPGLGTPLMQADQRAGIDLPQKILVHRGQSGAIYASYNTPGYLAARHAVDTVSTLSQIGGALQRFTEGATGSDSVQTYSADDVEEGEGLVEVESAFSVDSTFERLNVTIRDSTRQTTAAVLGMLDHAANAERVGMDLRPTRLLIVGSPVSSASLLQAEQSVGLDLPQKFLVYQDASGDVFLVYNDPFYLADRHGIEGRDDVLQQTSDLLEALAATATQAGAGS